MDRPRAGLASQLPLAYRGAGSVTVNWPFPAHHCRFPDQSQGVAEAEVAPSKIYWANAQLLLRFRRNSRVSFSAAPVADFNSPMRLCSEDRACSAAARLNS